MKAKSFAMKTKCLLLWLLLGVTVQPVTAQYIWVDCSFKAVRNPVTGQRYYAFTEADVDATLGEINRILASYERGYRFRRAGAIQDVGTVGDCNGPSKWFYVDLRAKSWTGACGSWTNSWDNFTQMEYEARFSNSVAYAWNSNAVNFYITAGYGPVGYTNGQPIGAIAGNAAYPDDGGWMIALGSVHAPQLILHEFGHHMQLPHTQGGCAGCSNPNNCFSTNGYWVGDDGIADTLPVAAGDFCFTNQNFVALANFNLLYTNCSALQKQQVDDVYFNLMAYGFGRDLDRLTPLQLDRWTDYANGTRRPEFSGLTRFVSITGNNANSGLTSTASKRTVLNAVTSSAIGGGDIVLLRPGNYNEQITLNRRVTLRVGATNSFAGFPRHATIGKP